MLKLLSHELLPIEISGGTEKEEGWRIFLQFEVSQGIPEIISNKTALKNFDSAGTIIGR
ncbi:hypothetical protein [Criblamydia sequanensis]|uniref:hypothetical protein n=1 Tax=Candidatus Criblamydia sequanensis TaxID=340071 RepID=UPI0012AB8421|nr:hypothetical protein [Criblamydia sequanensis]